MGTAPNGYNTPKTNWAAGNIPAASDFNRIEGNIYAVEEGNRTIDPAQVPASNQGSLRQLLDWFANRIKAITGKTNWYDTPSKTLEDLNTHINTAAPHSGHAPLNHTHPKADVIDFAHTHSINEITNLFANIPLTLKQEKSGKDSNGIYTQVNYKREDGTLYMRSVLSGGTSPQYTTRTITVYDTDGTTALETITHTLTYDSDGNVVSEL
ncbi:hypothetical protein [Caloramator sp. Dgby_cultured_2]|uniref:hypothetical protein n=1 Tax=Caloramator sp. Dgby_cultured_2 TaxID=3029174 RepID=UPI00237D72D4|nr:hypothetical protein [Caloramator sp. Dgby_cultured_2]WDU82261.1 hypothetical protein PWK10_11180 [Caloramator sp. Dgby_cultured_2]